MKNFISQESKHVARMVLAVAFAISLIDAHTAQAVVMTTQVLLETFGAVTSLILVITIVTGLSVFLNSIKLLYEANQPTANPGEHSAQRIIAECVAGLFLMGIGTVYGIMRRTVDPTTEWTSDPRQALAMETHGIDIDLIDGIETQGILAEYMPVGLTVTVLGFLFCFGLAYMCNGVYMIRYIGRQAPNAGLVGFGLVFWRIVGGMGAMSIVDVGCIFAWFTGLSLLCIVN